MKVFISPQFTTPDRGEGGIRRVVEAQIKYLPDHGIRIAKDLGSADITLGHGMMAPRKGNAPFVSACHGLHWRDYDWANWAHEVNKSVIDNLITADAITVPSEWVRNAVVRGILRRPTVVYHGVDPDEWAHSEENQGYVLWNKGRIDPVSDPRDMVHLARLMTDTKFISTFGWGDTDKPRNLKVLGHQPLSKLKPFIQKAGVMLMTSRETFGVGILEALAAGVPVAGWDYGGMSEIIVEGQTGYLAPFGDFERLTDCVNRCLAERDRLSANAIDDVRSRWQWPDKIEKYAAVLKDVWNRNNSRRPIISVVVTSFNLGRYLPDALSSVLAQSFQDWECIIVDDHSTDNTAEIAQDFAKRDPRFKYHKTPHNLKLCGALNYGFDQSTGKYVVNLDGDNKLPARALEIQVDALNDDPSIHIVCGDLDLISDDGLSRRDKIWHNKTDYDWRSQLAHINQIHSSSMMRREVHEELGGYRVRMWRAEDAEFWTRATSFGFRAKIVTSEPTLEYRVRSDSKSAYEYNNFTDKDGDWCADFPYRLASNAQDGSKILSETKGIPNAHIVPFAAQGKPTINSGLAWNVYHHQAPLVSVIIPVGNGHKRFVIDALDSLVAQDFIDWEAIIINDSDDEWNSVEGAPYAKVLRTDRRGAGNARNVGITHARGKLIYFLDADDYLLPGKSLTRMVLAYIKENPGYVYSDYLEVNGEHEFKLVKLNDYDEHSNDNWKGQHAINVLIAKVDLEKVNLFDADLPAWEDWDLFAKLRVIGICGYRLATPTFAYRFTTGKRREESFDMRGDIIPVLAARYKEVFDTMDSPRSKMSNCCGGNADALLEAKATLERIDKLSGMSQMTRELNIVSGTLNNTTQLEMVRMEFIGERIGGVTYPGNNGRQYRGGNNAAEKYVDAHPDDVARLESMGVWRIVPKPIVETPDIVIEPVDIPDPVQNITETQAFALSAIGAAQAESIDQVKVIKSKKKSRKSRKVKA